MGQDEYLVRLVKAVWVYAISLIGRFGFVIVVVGFFVFVFFWRQEFLCVTLAFLELTL